jgi:predicted DCC family thiol-disulfide oxidoreductase YuxK
MKTEAGESSKPPAAGPACLVYDGECEFCRGWAARWQRMAGNVVESIPAKEAATRFPGLAAGELERAVHLVEPDGRVSKGAEAAVRAWALAGRSHVPRWLYLKVPGLAGCMEFAYRFVARHRRRPVA